MDIPIIQEEEYDTATELIKDFSIGKKSGLLNRFIFRGHSSLTYELVPVALRQGVYEKLLLYSGIIDQGPLDTEDKQIRYEYNLLREFFLAADRRGLPLPPSERIRKDLFYAGAEMSNMRVEKWIPPDLRELAGLAQHYGIFTRLLDWTFDIYVALWFAASGVLENPKYEELVAGKKDSIAIWALNAWYFDINKPIPFINSDSYHNLPIVFIRPSYYGNPNLQAQSGVFTLWEIDRPIRFMPRDAQPLVDRTPLDQLFIKHITDQKLTEPILYKFVLPQSECLNIIKMLDRLDYNKSRLFPGYAGVAQTIQDRSKYNKI